MGTTGAGVGGPGVTGERVVGGGGGAAAKQGSLLCEVRQHAS